MTPEAAAIGRFHVGRFTWKGEACTAAGTGYTGEDGVEVAVPADIAPVFADIMKYALTAGGVVPSGTPRPQFRLAP